MFNRSAPLDDCLDFPAVFGRDRPHPGFLFRARIAVHAEVFLPPTRSTRTRCAISIQVVKRVQDMSVQAFRALGCEGMARVDFFLLPDMSVVVNEVNTIPGFTNISMYPLAFGASGVSYPELVDRLIRHALARAGRAPASYSAPAR